MCSLETWSVQWGAAALDLDLRGGRGDLRVGIVHDFQDLGGVEAFSAPSLGSPQLPGYHVRPSLGMLSLLTNGGEKLNPAQEFQVTGP